VQLSSKQLCTCPTEEIQVFKISIVLHKFPIIGELAAPNFALLEENYPTG